MAEHAVEVAQTNTADTGGGLFDTLTGGFNTFLQFKLTQQQLSADQKQQTGKDFKVGEEAEDKPFSLLGLSAGELAALVAGAVAIAFGLAKLTEK